MAYWKEKRADFESNTSVQEKWCMDSCLDAMEIWKVKVYNRLSTLRKTQQQAKSIYDNPKLMAKLSKVALASAISPELEAAFKPGSEPGYVLHDNDKTISAKRFAELDRRVYDTFYQHQNGLLEDAGPLEKNKTGHLN